MVDLSKQSYEPEDILCKVRDKINPSVEVLMKPLFSSSFVWVVKLTGNVCETSGKTAEASAGTIKKTAVANVNRRDRV
jgi:hypothetical protein